MTCVLNNHNHVTMQGSDRGQKRGDGTQEGSGQHQREDGQAG